MQSLGLEMVWTLKLGDYANDPPSSLSFSLCNLPHCVLTAFPEEDPLGLQENVPLKITEPMNSRVSSLFSEEFHMIISSPEADR